MKIVQVINSLEPAGAERVVVSLARGLRERGHEVNVLTLTECGNRDLVEELSVAGIPEKSLEASRGRPDRLCALRKELAAGRPDVVHAHLFHSHMVTRWSLGRGPGLPARVETHHTLDHRRGTGWRFLLDRWTRRPALVTTCVSHRGARFLEARLGLERDAVRVVHDGVAPPASGEESGRALLRRDWEIEPDAFLLGAVGRLIPDKGFDLLIDAFAEGAAGRTPPWRMVILGEGPERPRLEERIARLPADLRPRLPGFRPDAPACMTAFNVLLVPSRREGFGLVAAEGMIRGLPVVTSPADALPELVDAYPAGRVASFAPGERGPLLEHLRRLAGEPPPRRPDPRFSVEAMVEGYLEVYDEARRRAGGPS